MQGCWFNSLAPAPPLGNVDMDQPVVRNTQMNLSKRFVCNLLYMYLPHTFQSSSAGHFLPRSILQKLCVHLVARQLNVSYLESSGRS